MIPFTQAIEDSLALVEQRADEKGASWSRRIEDLILQKKKHARKRSTERKKRQNKRKKKKDNENLEEERKRIAAEKKELEEKKQRIAMERARIEEERQRREREREIADKKKNFENNTTSAKLPSSTQASSTDDITQDEPQNYLVRIQNGSKIK